MRQTCRERLCADEDTGFDFELLCCSSGAQPHRENPQIIAPSVALKKKASQAGL